MSATRPATEFSIGIMPRSASPEDIADSASSKVAENSGFAAPVTSSVTALTQGTTSSLLINTTYFFQVAALKNGGVIPPEMLANAKAAAGAITPEVGFVGEGGGEGLAARVVRHFLEEGRADALRRAAQHLAIGDERVQQHAAVGHDLHDLQVVLLGAGLVARLTIVSAF